MEATKTFYSEDRMCLSTCNPKKKKPWHFIKREGTNYYYKHYKRDVIICIICFDDLTQRLTDLHPDQCSLTNKDVKEIMAEDMSIRNKTILY